jgi:hypothetical protein
MTTKRGLILLAGYLVRFPLGGFAWQAAHYLLGLQRLGYEVWFYEDTGYFAPAFDPIENSFTTDYGYGLAAVARFLESLGLGERWIFQDAQRRQASGPGAGRLEALFREADLVINLGLMNRCTMEKRRGLPAIYIDLDPAYTQIRLINGDPYLRAVLDSHTQLFTFGENIGTLRSPVPTGGYDWQATRPPVVLELWAGADGPGRAYTTVGQWTSQGGPHLHGRPFHWDKRRVLRFLDIRGGHGDAGDGHERGSGWSCGTAVRQGEDRRSLEVSLDPWQLPRYLPVPGGNSRGKEMNICLRSGCSGPPACDLAAAGPWWCWIRVCGLPFGARAPAFVTRGSGGWPWSASRRITAGVSRKSKGEGPYFDAEKVLSRLLARSVLGREMKRT